MDQQNIDRLFREKLDGMEVIPSAQAWSQVEKQIRPQKKPAIYWIAASVSLFFISWVFWPEQVPNNPILSEVNYPALPGNPELIAPIAIDLNEIKDKEHIKKKVSPQKNQAKFASLKEEAPVQEKVLLPESETKIVVAINEVEESANTETLPLVESPVEEFSPIKITYIASTQVDPKSTETQKNDSTGVLRKFIAFADKIDPGEVLADFKMAKDNLLNGGLKNKKDRSSLNP